MSIERRESPRAILNREAVVKTRNLPIYRCRIRDIGAEGAFIELDDHILVPEMNVNLELNILVDGENKVLELSAHVYRVSADGVSLRFEQMDIDRYGAVLGLVYSG
ncbi:MAG: PilZ domain-containing protein [Gammaproteobacteria bacterium]|nr:PilZ domain-containing protein [Gammaproteobacteria bacterium]